MARADFPAAGRKLFFLRDVGRALSGIAAHDNRRRFFGALAIAGERKSAAKVFGVGLLPLVWLLVCFAVNSLKRPLRDGLFLRRRFSPLRMGDL